MPQEVAKIKGLDIRDKKIVDSTAVTSVTQTDSIRMTTTNGEEVFIARDSFVDAIASVFKSNAKSSITSLFGELTESNVSSVGSINMSNLASVLSVKFGSVISVTGTKLSEITDIGYYSGSFSSITDRPSAESQYSYFVMIVFGWWRVVGQILFSGGNASGQNGGRCYVRAINKGSGDVFNWIEI